MYCSKSTSSLLRQPLARVAVWTQASAGLGEEECEAKSRKGQVWGSLGEGKATSSQEKEKDNPLLHLGTAPLSPKSVCFGLRSFWIKACGLQLPDCCPLSEIIIFCTCQWDMVRGKLCFWRSKCQGCQIAVNRHIYIHFSKKERSLISRLVKLSEDWRKN